MKKVFEFILVLIIFYGIYELFAKIANSFFKDMDPVLVILISLIISAILLLIYRFVLIHEVKTKMKGEVHALHKALKEKDEAIKKAQTFKDELIKEAEESASLEEDNI
jgi:uncharacterized membrane protein (DUF106 family)